MKNIYLLTLSLFLLSACGTKKEDSLEAILKSNNLEKLREKRTEIITNQQEINQQLKQIDVKIAELDTTKKIPLITTFKAKDTLFNHYLELQGSVSTKENLIIYPEFSGTLTNIYVKEGQRVSKGQVLGKIDDGGLSQQVAQAKIQTNLAKTTFERQQRLWNQKIGSEIEFLQAKSNYNAQQEMVNQLEKQLQKTQIRAPFSGTIDDVITEQGSVVAAGQSQLMRIVNLSEMYIETDVPESYISSITKGKNVEVDFPILNTKINTKIRQVGNFINPANRTFKVEIAVPNKDKSIKPNLTAKLKINDYTNKKAILIPQNIISENANGEQYVYIIENKNENNEGTAKRIIIETGLSQGETIEVVKGITNNTEIIQEGARSVKNNQTVKVLNL